jgi:RNA polymerase sigma-70 factor, ECF subfamily
MRTELHRPVSVEAIQAMELTIGAKLLSSGRKHDAVSELALVERCKRQDPEAFGLIVDAYQNRLYGFIKRMVIDAEEASDIAQEAFVRAYQSFGRFDGRSSVRTWLFRIAYNLCVDRARRNQRAPLETRIDATFEDDEQFEIADTRWNPETFVLDDELMAAAEQAISSMSEKLRGVLLLHDREDMAYDEIAKMLDVPIGTVKSRLFLARTHLQNALRPYLQREVDQNV